jgi:hypothetical protein
MEFERRDCDNCGHTFKPKRAAQRFCRTSCRRAYHSKTLRGLLEETVVPLRFLASLPGDILPFKSHAYPEMAAASLRKIEEKLGSAPANPGPL